MSEYKYLENFVCSIMSVETGLSEKQEAEAISRSLAKPEVKERLKAELAAALGDKDFSWSHFLDNECCCVFPGTCEEEAREFIVENLWNRIAKV
ncbi:hypothetical protein [Lysobacter capsici]|uniref:hypothetical protein n=1 Tax=Lysobacter capsici TaxID=435897 RepID=UPI00287B5E59|nr:hypothetical protein [Lysobacter capsici]WND79851.1 hypothetical protein RJ610_21605 [Lysobacter capsici]WND85047.1 hypothetical protein RJ609_21620 [Lysobacter capsici]